MRERFSILRTAALALLTLVLSLAGVSQSWAASLYCSPLGSGTKSGADWNNTIQGKPTTLVRGNTYYFASGAYGAWYFAPLAGTSTVTFKKATASDHGTSTGWNASYGTGAATITGVANLVNIATSYLVIDGQETDGFQFISTGTIDNGPVRIFNGSTANFLTIRYCRLEGVSGRTAVSQAKLFYNLANSYTDHTFEYCTFKNGGQTWITESTGSNLVIQYNTFDTCGSGSSSYHSAGFALAGNSNVTIRYNVFKNMIQNGSTTYIEPQITGNGMYIYGNVFYEDQPWAGCSQGVYAVTASDSFLNAYFYNNTAYGLHSGLPGIYLNSSGTSSAFATNNVWQSCSSSVNFSGNVVQGNNILNTGEVAFQGPSTGDFRLSANTSSGTTLSSPYDTDPVGTARVPGSWSKGAYQYTPLVGNPGTVNLSSNVFSVSEAAGFVTIPVPRVGGSTGAASVQYATSDGTAYAGTNYTATSGTLNWAGGDSTTKSFNVPVFDLDVYGYPTFNITLSSATGASLGAPSTAVVTILGTGSPPVSLLAWPGIWEAEDGQISAPFIISSGAVYQTATTTVAEGGSAAYSFTNPAPAYVKVAIYAKPQLAYENSLALDMDNANPTEPDMVNQFWPLSSSYLWYDTGWQGAGGNPDVSPMVKVWLISAGVHTLNIRGREQNTKFDKVEVIKLVTNTISSVSTTQTNGWYKAGVTIPITVNLPVAGTVTGTPLLALNVGANASYASGSGTTNLIFNYTVGSGQNVTNLDYTSANALTLNGGTIKDSGGVDFTLTLPAPGDPGSLGSGRSIVIDTTAPTVLIGEPSVTVVRAGTVNVSFQLSYNDPYLDYARPAVSDITLNQTGGVTATKSVTGANNVWFVTLSSISVPSSGSFSISVAANTAVDLAGNLASAAGPSSSVAVYTVGGGSIHVYQTTRANIVVSKP